VFDASLDHSSNLKHDYVPRLLKLEREDLKREVCDKKISIVFDATPCMGDVFILIVHFVHTNASMACVNHQLVHVSFMRGSQNAHTQCGELQDDLQLFCLKHNDFLAESMDGSSTNTRTINLIEDQTYVKWMTNICFSHCSNNAGQ
jgi:hypothetical protein